MLKCLEGRRRFSSLADKLREAVSFDPRAARKADGASGDLGGRHDAIDEAGEPYRELFVMPKRKLGPQIAIERQTGRAEILQRPRLDFHDRMAVRRPRERDMREDQDWPSVWPAARSFASSVVPLPIRMGTRKHPEKRAPFKKEGNLELVKIPNFLHLTPAAIQRHCEAIKIFCTPFPPELKAADSKAAWATVPLTLSYADYVHQGNNIRDMRARVVTLKLKLSALSLSEHARDKMIRLAGNRYDEAEELLTITTDRCYTRAQNLDYAYYLLTVLFHESNKVEPWEEMKQRVDELKVNFDGSSTKDKLVDLLDKLAAVETISTPVKEALTAPEGGEEKARRGAIARHEKVTEFGEMWQKYRNTEETPESTREYAKKVRELLGIKSVGDSKKATKKTTS